MKRACEHCRYYVTRNESDGFCKRNAPSPLGEYKRACWPIVDSDDWCGEYKSTDDDGWCGERYGG